jgi:enamine deaminase RidA (YjgF/YER057c/UK114 family)
MGGVGDRHGSGGPWEDRFGYSRVVRVGPLALTAGCTAVVDGVLEGKGDAGLQARIAIGTALAALTGVGIRPEDVIASRLSITDRANAEQVGLAHGEIFRTIKPVATMVIVQGLLDPDMLVEVDLTAWAG